MADRESPRGAASSKFGGHGRRAGGVLRALDHNVARAASSRGGARPKDDLGACREAGGGDEVSRLQCSVDSLEISNGLLREERDSLSALLARRDETCRGLEKKLAAAQLRQRELEADLQAARTTAEAAVAGGAAEAKTWVQERAALEAQVQDLQEKWAAEEGQAAEQASQAAESLEKQVKLRDEKILRLQEDLRALHHKDQADLKDWQERYEEAVAVRKAVESRLEHVQGLEGAVGLVCERQTLLSEALQSARELLAEKARAVTAREQGLGAASSEQQASPAQAPRPDSAQAIVEGIIDEVLAQALERATCNEKLKGLEERALERDTELEMQVEAAAMLHRSLNELAEEMVTLREYGVTEAASFQEEAQELRDELSAAVTHREAALAELGRIQEHCREEAGQLMQRLEKEEHERRQLEATLQLSELALAAKAGEGERERDDAQAARVAELERHKQEALEALDAQNKASAERLAALEGDNRALRQRVDALRSHVGALKTGWREGRGPASPGGQATRTSTLEEGRFLKELVDGVARERELEGLRAQLAVAQAEKEVLARRVSGQSEGGVSLDASSGGKGGAGTPAQLQCLDLERAVARLRAELATEQESGQRIRDSELQLRKFMLRHHARTESQVKPLLEGAAVPLYRALATSVTNVLGRGGQRERSEA